jgi:hypothetical protein
MWHERYTSWVVGADIRWCDAFFHVSKLTWRDRFSAWWRELRVTSPLDPTPQRENRHAVLMGRLSQRSKTRRIHYVVTSTETPVPVLIVELMDRGSNHPHATTFFGGHPAKYHVLDLPKDASPLLRRHLDLVHEAVYGGTWLCDVVHVDEAGMRQLYEAGSTPRWVANKLAGKYDDKKA